MSDLNPKVKRLLSIGLFAAVVFLGARTCAVEGSECALRFQVEGLEIEELRARLYEKGGNEMIGQYRQRYAKGQAGARWPMAVSAGEYRLEGEAILTSGARSFRGPVTLVDGKTISVHLGDFLR